MIGLQKQDFVRIMNENGQMKSKLESVEHACSVFLMRNPMWIINASKEQLRTLTMSILTIMKIDQTKSNTTK